MKAEEEGLFVDSYGADRSSWFFSGSSPYLDDSDSFIHQWENDVAIGDFGFPDSAIGSGTISSTKLSFECSKDAAGNNFRVFVWDGSWVDKGLVESTIVGYSWVDLDVSTEIDTWLKVDGCEIYLVSNVSGMNEVYVRRCKLVVSYTIGGETFELHSSINVNFGLSEFTEWISGTIFIFASINLVFDLNNVVSGGIVTEYEISDVIGLVILTFILAIVALCIALTKKG